MVFRRSIVPMPLSSSTTVGDEMISSGLPLPQLRPGRRGHSVIHGTHGVQRQ